MVLYGLNICEDQEQVRTAKDYDECARRWWGDAHVQQRDAPTELRICESLSLCVSTLFVLAKRSGVKLDQWRWEAEANFHFRAKRPRWVGGCICDRYVSGLENV